MGPAAREHALFGRTTPGRLLGGPHPIWLSTPRRLGSPAYSHHLPRVIAVPEAASKREAGAVYDRITMRRIVPGYHRFPLGS